MRAVSNARARENRQRRAVLTALYEAAPWCAVDGEALPFHMLDGHELLSRARGGSITDPDNIRLVCRRHHNLITTEPAWAAANGWALSQYGEAS